MFEWSATGNEYAFVYGANVYYRPSVKAESTLYPISNDGQQFVVFNGVPDWVYEGKKSIYIKITFIYLISIDDFFVFIK